MRYDKWMIRILCLAVCIGLAQVGFASEKMVGFIDEIQLAEDGASAKVMVMDNATDELVPLIIKDDLTLEKLKDNRIVLDDEVRVKYEVEADGNVAVYFRKTAGC